MDVSEEYVKMCDCSEIQDNWKPEIGDCNCNGQGCGFAINLKGIEKSLDTWLPRQDQLQEMCGYDYPERLFRFYEFIQKEYLYSQDNYAFLPELEQLWLAFVMSEKFGKVWTGKEWVKK